MEIKKYPYIKLCVILIAGITIGNRLFNHVHAWFGIAVIIATIIYFIYKITKQIRKDEVI